MPQPIGWDEPDWKSMSGDDLRDHLVQMRAIGESYLQLNSHGNVPPTEDLWQEWLKGGVPGLRAWHLQLPGGEPGPREVDVADLVAGTRGFEMRHTQTDVNIHPFPGGCLYEQTAHYELPNGTHLVMCGVHIFHADSAGKMMRLHTYYESMRPVEEPFSG